MTRTIEITTFGYLHDVPPSADITLDLRRFRDPHISPLLPELDAHDTQAVGAVLFTPGILGLLHAAAGAARACLDGPTDAPVRVAVGCADGRHRATGAGDVLACDLVCDGHDVRLIHRDIDKPVADRGTSCSALVYTPRLLRRARLHTCTLADGHGRDHLDETSGHAWTGGVVFVPARPAWQRSLRRAARRIGLGGAR